MLLGSHEIQNINNVDVVDIDKDVSLYANDWRKPSIVEYLGRKMVDVESVRAKKEDGTAITFTTK